MSTHPKLLEAWKERAKKIAEGIKLRAEGDEPYAEGMKLNAEGYKLHAEGMKLIAEGSKHCAEGDELRAKDSKLIAEDDKLHAKVIKLYAEGEQFRVKGYKLYAEADLFWINAIIEVYGEDMTMTWNYRKDVNDLDCILGNGEIYTVEMGKEKEEVNETDKPQ